MLAFLQILAQMDIETNQMEGRPYLSAEGGTAGMTWVIAAVVIAGILLVTFKTSKRNHVERT